MSTVHVDNFSDFVTAIAVSGDTVVLPGSAEWDMNEIQPEGTGLITIACDKIEGQGTKIKNLRSTGGIAISASTEIDDLEMTNIVGTGYAGSWYGGNAWMYAGAYCQPEFNRCTFSGAFTSNVVAFMGGVSGSGGSTAVFTLDFCAFNVELVNQTSYFLQQCYMIPTGCRAVIHLPNTNVGINAFNDGGSHSATNCEVVVYAPFVPIASCALFQGCTVRGNLQSCETILADSIITTSIYCTSDAPNAGISGSNFVGVTEAQMKDADYLHNTGFLIGTE